MTPSQVWDSFCSYVYKLFPNCIVKKQYRPIEDLEKLTEVARPMVWVGMSSVNIGSITTNATVVEDDYNFQLLLAWKLRNPDDQNELDNKLNNLQEFLTIFRHRYADVGNSRLYFGLPSCDSPFDEDLLISPGIYVATVTVPLTVYRDLNQTVKINNGDQDTASTEETTANDPEN